ncbi:retrovirus-related pol polyprotein from transposon TNT 1-94 [Tanacetum coccineum]
MHTTMVPEQVKTMKIQAGVQVSRPGELRRHLQLWKCFGRLYFVVIILDRNIVSNSVWCDPIVAITYDVNSISCRQSAILLQTSQLRNSSKPRQQATINDGRVTLQPVPGRANFFCYGIYSMVKTPTVITNNAAYQADDLDAYGFDFARPSSKQSSVVNHSETEITSDSNIILILKQGEKPSFQNPFYLKKAQQLEPKLYDGNVIKNTSAIVIPDSEETLMLAERESKLKGKDLADNVVTKHTIAPEMLKVDVEPIAHKLLNNRTAHSDYLRHTQEQATILREVVEQGKSQNPLNNSLDSAYSKLNVNSLAFYVQPKILMIPANNKEPSKSWGSIVSDVPSSSLDECRLEFVSIQWFTTWKVLEFTYSKLEFCDSTFEVALLKHMCFIRNLEGVDLLTGSRDNNLYTLSLRDMMVSSPICILSKASKTKSWLWHRRLSHLNFGAINHLARHGLLRARRNPTNLNLKTPTTRKPISFAHDLCGPMRYCTSVYGKKYILVIVDDYSRFTWVKCLRSKDVAPDFIIKFLKMIQLRLKAPVRRIRTDNGTVAPTNRLKIGKCNHRLSSTLKSNEPTLQLVLDALKLTPFYKAFQITANVPEIYMQEFWATVSIHHTSLRFKMNDKSHTLNLENFRDMLQICPRLPSQKFEDPPFDEEILSFIRDLGHTRETKILTDVNVNHMHQP